MLMKRCWRSRQIRCTRPSPSTRCGTSAVKTASTNSARCAGSIGRAASVMMSSSASRRDAPSNLASVATEPFGPLHPRAARFLSRTKPHVPSRFRRGQSRRRHGSTRQALPFFPSGSRFSDGNRPDVAGRAESRPARCRDNNRVPLQTACRRNGMTRKGSAVRRAGTCSSHHHEQRHDQRPSPA
jgi:hypothetical protein